MPNLVTSTSIAYRGSELVAVAGKVALAQTLLGMARDPFERIWERKKIALLLQKL